MRRKDKYPNTEIFTFLNLNPKKRITGDCVIRAIAKATKLSWEEVARSLADTGIKNGHSQISEKTYNLFLTEKGFEKMPQPRHPDNTKYTFREFVEEHPRGTYLVHLVHHLTVVVNGKNYDIWDCTRRGGCVGNYWKKK